jgi:hypothetical protein
MAVLANAMRFSLFASVGSAAMLEQAANEESFEVGFDSVRRQVAQSGTFSDDDPIRRQQPSAPHLSAGAHSDGFIHHETVNHRGAAAASMLELGSEEDTFKSHMKDLVAHGMKRHILQYSRHQGWECETHGQALNMTMVKCKATCDQDLACTCFQYDKQSSSCFMQKAAQCVRENCKRAGGTDVYIQQAVWAKDALSLVRHKGMDCRAGRGATELDAPETAPTALSLKKCKERCASDQECTCFKWDRTMGQCLKMKECRTHECGKSGTIDTYLHEAVYNGYAQKFAGSDW